MIAQMLCTMGYLPTPNWIQKYVLSEFTMYVLSEFTMYVATMTI